MKLLFPIKIWIMQYILEQHEYDHYQELKRHAEVTQGQCIVISRPDPDNKYCSRTYVYNIPEGLEEIRKDLESLRKAYDLIGAWYNESVLEMKKLNARNSAKWWKFYWK